ncbi:MAG TPA: tetratricopeptide repeat protein, partial [Thermoanaerobaculia bacterium]|nr:tetratricopeptide repeat protein [Thermoanaerobaculia bacterium]
MIALVLAAALDIARAIELTNEWKLDEAEAIATKSLAEAIACNDLVERAQALDVLGIVARSRGDLDAALDYTSEALALAEYANDADLLARTYNDLGRILEGDRARDAYRRGLAQRPHNRVIVVRLLNNLGNLERDESDLAEAVRLYERAR